MIASCWRSRAAIESATSGNRLPRSSRSVTRFVSGSRQATPGRGNGRILSRKSDIRAAWRQPASLASVRQSQVAEFKLYAIDRFCGIVCAGSQNQSENYYPGPILGNCSGDPRFGMRRQYEPQFATGTQNSNSRSVGKRPIPNDGNDGWTRDRNVLKPLRRSSLGAFLDIVCLSSVPLQGV